MLEGSIGSRKMPEFQVCQDSLFAFRQGGKGPRDSRCKTKFAQNVLFFHSRFHLRAYLK